MLRINLLPRTINEAARKKTFLAIWAVANAAVVVLFLIWLGGVQASYNVAKSANDDAHDKKNTYDGVVSKIGDVNNEIADTQKKEDFVANSQKYNDAWPATFDLMRDVTSDHVVLHSLSIDPAAHKTLNVAGFSPDEATIIGWWMYLRNNKDKFDSVTFTLPPHGYQPGETGATGLGMGSGMMGGPMGGGMMRPGRMGGMMGGGGAPMGMTSSSMGAMMRGGGPPMGMMGGGAPGMMGMGRGTSAAGNASESYLEGRKGIEFTAMVVLKEAMAGGMPAPTWPPADAGGTGGMTGMMGGMGPGGPMGGMGPGGPMGGMPGAPMGGMRGPAGAPPQAGGAASSSKKGEAD